MDAQLFVKQKTAILSSVDLSRKGSVDADISELIQRINDHPNLVSLSSCSGRIVVFRDVATDAGKVVKKGCEWLLVSHEEVDCKQVWEKIKTESGQSGCITVKFEPFILHVQCRDIQTAKRMHLASVESGFRNSGITVGKIRSDTQFGKIVVATRSSHGLEFPITNENGQLLVGEEFIQFALGLANEKMKKNREMHGRFLGKFQELC